MNILDFFQFSSASWLMLIGRFAILLVSTGFLAFIVTFVMVLCTKTKKHEIGFSNWFKVCLLWGINITMAFLGIVVILTLRANGLYYFSVESLGWSWYCGWLLMTPEIFLMISWLVTYWIVNSHIKKSINY